MTEAFLASLFSASVAGVAISAALGGLAIGTLLGWSARDAEINRSYRRARYRPTH